MTKKKMDTVVEPLDIVINGEFLRDKIHVIRGQKVMLDYDLAEIYGYTTSAFNQQVARNIDRFDGDDFMFRLARNEADSLVISQNVISRTNKLFNGQGGGSRHLPHAFTEQGVYMLMTVLRGELAVKQSRALIRLFKDMKDYIIENQAILGYRNNLETVKEIVEKTQNIAEAKIKLEIMNSEIKEIETKVRKMENKLGNAVLRSEISPILLDFGKVVEQKEYVFLDGEPTRASELYMGIYEKAKRRIYIIDNYIGIKTLGHLRSVKSNIDIVIFSDNIGNYLRREDYNDFKKERNDLNIRLIKTEGKVHDRFIVIDYKEEGEMIYHCGPSEKDAGKRLAMISQCRNKTIIEAINNVVDKMLKNNEIKWN